MICKDCAYVADSDRGDGTEAIVESYRLDDGRIGFKGYAHCANDLCTCQHKPRGSWAGVAVG